jgi:hypothetical protein
MRRVRTWRTNHRIAIDQDGGYLIDHEGMLVVRSQVEKRVEEGGVPQQGCQGGLIEKTARSMSSCVFVLSLFGELVIRVGRRQIWYRESRGVSAFEFHEFELLCHLFEQHGA